MKSYKIFKTREGRKEGKRKQREMEWTGTVSNMVNINSTISMITLNVNDLNYTN